MRLAIVGSRKYVNLDNVRRFIDNLRPEIQIISGGAYGVDSVAASYCKATNRKIDVYPADWIRNGRSAGPIRNSTIVENSDGVIAFLMGNSPGTKNTIYKATVSGKLMFVFDDVAMYNEQLAAVAKAVNDKSLGYERYVYGGRKEGEGPRKNTTLFS